MSEKVENNWYEILELDFYLDPKEDEQKIKKIIEEKNKYWVRNQRDRKIGMLCTKYIEYNKKGKILKDILDDEKRSQMIKDVQKKLFEGIDRYLVTFENEVMTEEKIRYILNKIKEEHKIINEKIIKERIWSRGKKVGIGSYEKFEENLKRAFDLKLSSKFENIEKNLKAFGKANIYDFLNSQELTLNFLNKREIEEKIKFFEKNDSESDLKKKLCLFCKDLVEKDEIEKYNEYLEKMECLKIEKELEVIKNEKKRLRRKKIESEIENFESKFGDTIEDKVAREFFSKYFGYKFVSDKNKGKLGQIDISKIKEWMKLRKKILVKIAVGLVFIFVVIFSWNLYNKKEAEKIFVQAEKYMKEGNKEKAKERYEIAARKGNTDAMNKLGEYYYAKENSFKAEEWYKKAAKGGNIKAMENLMNFYNRYSSNEKVIEWGTKAAAKGNTIAMNNLGKFYENNGDKVKAKEWYEKAAAKGETTAMNNLGVFYENNGDKVKSKEWVEKAAVKGNTVAMANLGVFYENNGNKVKAKEWYEKAAAKGDTIAMNNLGVYYENNGDRVKAKEWYEKAATKGSKEAKEALEKMKKD
ncbi:sel1 repeat family protein [Leptotrichia sp. oral taxon 218]|uniref:tetratricopeptide repeat protein n=1 Tax=Leptotrichia sp. oral taxon 218 TaxID=712361 RepID=UPI001B8C5211|nr:tetratricopeptide repeat protein [Leptotrichia sp. oral taxon 218]QUB96005.1 sel1 repeat family protein [Leptotrichia sp. oral taxon 218]